jgi:hypothetical protein
MDLSRSREHPAATSANKPKSAAWFNRDLCIKLNIADLEDRW